MGYAEIAAPNFFKLDTTANSKRYLEAPAHSTTPHPCNPPDTTNTPLAVYGLLHQHTARF